MSKPVFLFLFARDFPVRSFTCRRLSSKSSTTVSLGESLLWVSAPSGRSRSTGAVQRRRKRRRTNEKRRMDGDVRDRNSNKDPNCGFALNASSFLCVVCQGETSHITTGDVFIDIDDQEPLVPEQVKPAGQS